MAARTSPRVQGSLPLKAPRVRIRPPSSRNLICIPRSLKIRPISRNDVSPLLTCGGHPHLRTQTPSEGVQPETLPFPGSPGRPSSTRRPWPHCLPRSPSRKSKCWIAVKTVSSRHGLALHCRVVVIQWYRPAGRANETVQERQHLHGGRRPRRVAPRSVPGQQATLAAWESGTGACR
jgi:hypothetical protein